MSLNELSGEALILLFRVGLVLALYLFLFAVVAVIRGELRAQQRGRALAPGRLVIVNAGSSGLPPGHGLPLQPVTTLGRSPSCTLVLNDTFVSTTHAVLTWRGNQWWIRDLGSTNGTRLNQEPLPAAESPVAYGDAIDVGNVRLKLAP